MMTALRTVQLEKSTLYHRLLLFFFSRIVTQLTSNPPPPPPHGARVQGKSHEVSCLRTHIPDGCAEPATLRPRI